MLNLSPPEPSRLVLHFSTPSPLRDLDLTLRLSSTLAHIIAHPPALLKHLATTHLTPPPPASTPDRFRSVFAPLSARTWEAERIVLGPGGVGLGDDGEIVLQVVTRGRGRNVERDLDGWTLNGPCSLSDLDSLKGIVEDRGKPARAEVSEQVVRVFGRRGMTIWNSQPSSGNPMPKSRCPTPTRVLYPSSLDPLCHLTHLLRKMLPSHREPSSTIPIRQTTLTTTIRMKIWTFDSINYKSEGRVQDIKYRTNIRHQAMIT